MSDSLRDQLLKAGLVTERQAKQASQQSKLQQHQQTRAPKKQRQAQAHAPHAPSAAQQQAAAAKAARDQELNRRQQEKIAARARAAEITQILEQHSIARDAAAEDYFNFISNGKVRRMSVTPAERERIVGGTVVIVRWSGRVHLVPPEAAERIRERHPTAVIDLPAAPATTTDENDPYKDFVVPDDLTW
jgi:uncharacterized protein YaiL (DUF2058 family)